MTNEHITTTNELNTINSTLDLSENAYSEMREIKTVLIIGITSNRGLCGGFNNNIIKRVAALQQEDYANTNVKLLCLGKKIKDAYKNSLNYYINPVLAPLEDVYADLK
jgi:F-type H+-transporting ATPase subunit gamma